MQPPKKKLAEFSEIFIVSLLNSAGIGLDWQHAKLRMLLSVLKYYLLYSFIFVTSFLTILIKDCKTIYELSLILAYVFNGIFLNVSTLILHLKKQHIISILDLVNGEIPIVMSRHKYTVPGSEKFKTFFYSHAIKCYTVYLFACMGPFLFFPISSKKIGDPKTLLIPTWFPWKIDSGLKYILTVGLQFSWLGPLSTPCLLNFTFIVYFIIEVRTQFDILYEDVLEIKRESCSYKYDDRMMVKLKTCIRHYQLISGFVENFCSCYKWVFTADLIYSLANLSLILYGIVSGEKSISALGQQFSAFLMVFSILFSFCYVGETLENANDKLEKCLYDIEWFNQTIKFRKLFLVFIGIVRKRMNLKAGSRFVASYELFSSVLKVSYSYFNILTTTFSN